MLIEPGTAISDTRAARWEALEVVAEMAEPVIYYDDGMHLDGILAYGAYLALPQDVREALPPIVSEWAVDFELPLAKWERRTPDGSTPDVRLLSAGRDVWGWCASAAHAEWLQRGKMEFRRRPEVWQMMRYTAIPSHNVGAGAHKAYDIAHPTCFAREVRWWALGDRAGVEALLARVRNVGKKGALGMGRVLRWEVREVREDWSIERGGVLTRRMPVDGGRSAGIRAPYHHRSRLVPCALPGDLA